MVQRDRAIAALMSLAVALTIQPGCGYDPPILVTRVAPATAKLAPVALPPPHRPATPADADPAQIIGVNNALGFELYAKVRSRPGNLLIAPAPLMAGLGLLRAGAREKTAAELDRVLHRQTESNAPRWQRGLAALIATLNGDGRAPSFDPTQPPRTTYQIRLADSLWIQSGYSVRDDYQSLLSDLFGIKDNRVDFRRDPVAACQTINQWTGVQTGGRIAQVMSPESLPAQTKLVMSICLYLRATWQKPFLEQSTRDELFRVGRIEQVRVPMMHEHSYAADFDYWENGTLQALEIASAGGDCRILILLPKASDGLDCVERSLRPELLDSWIKKKHAPEEIDIQLPRFRFNSRFSLKESLAELGICQAFESTADFSGINGKSNDLFIQDIVHAATIDVNERGIEAAAAVEYISPDSIGAEPVSFHADHPFVFLVRDNRTGCVLFLGRLADPTPSAGTGGS